MKKNNLSSDPIKITPTILKAVRDAIRATLAYERATNCGRKFGITGEVGEILVCHKLGLRLSKQPRSEGFDAIDRKNNRVQIKTRRSERDELPADAGSTSTFSKHRFSYALLALLDRDYKLVEVWRADYHQVERIIRKHKRTRRNLTIRQFKSVEKKPIYPRSQGKVLPN
jgi:hypothetical protein